VDRDCEATMSRSQLTLRSLTKRYADRVVLDRVNLTLRPGERVGIIGENGAGKSTLLRVIAGDLSPDAGELVIEAPGGLSVLAQALELPEAATVQDAIDECWHELRGLEQEIADAGEALAHAGDLEAALGRFGDLLDQFEARDGYGAPARLESALGALGVAGIARARAWATLSGGERSRTALAATLAANAELLLLDEPTNDLDDAGWEWLLQTLRAHRGTVVAVSHDRAFLEEFTDVILAVSDGRVTRYGAGYRGYVAARRAETERQRLAHEAWKDEIARHRELLTANAGRLDAIPRKLEQAGMGAGAFRARSRDHGAMSRIRNAKERLARLTEEPIAAPPQPLRFTPAFTPADTDQKRASNGGDDAAIERESLLRLTDVRVAGTSIASVDLRAGDRLLITGPNGIGKTTLLRAISGEEHPLSGHIHLGGRVGYLRQHASFAPEDRTVAEAFACAKRDDRGAAEDRLVQLGLFRREELGYRLSELSYGQRRRLDLAVLVSDQHEVLLLDEPTNHLAPELVDELESALNDFGGVVVVVTHDRRLRDHVGGLQLELKAEK
jgi:macrolide transport system ATP-binding/permease protein